MSRLEVRVTELVDELVLRLMAVLRGASIRELAALQLKKAPAGRLPSKPAAGPTRKASATRPGKGARRGARRGQGEPTVDTLVTDPERLLSIVEEPQKTADRPRAPRASSVLTAVTAPERPAKRAARSASRARVVPEAPPAPPPAPAFVLRKKRRDAEPAPAAESAARLEGPPAPGDAGGAAEPDATPEPGGEQAEPAASAGAPEDPAAL